MSPASAHRAATAAAPQSARSAIATPTARRDGGAPVAAGRRATSASSAPTSAASASSAPDGDDRRRRVRARDWSARQPILVTYSLIAINVAVFVWMVARDTENLNPGGQLTQEQIDLGLNEQLRCPDR